MSKKNVFQVPSMGAVLLLFAFTAYLSGCATLAAKSKAREEAREALGQTREDWNEQRTEFLDESEQRLNDIANDVNEMQSSRIKIQNSERARAQVRELSSMLENVREELRALKDVGAEQWESEKDEFLGSLNALEKKFESTRRLYE